ncbi:MAG: cyclic nucleotide-binding domain-containing protein, partial [Oscillospiraceae bacterium]|nr:cyclic nucleotide-binding domain-containing protein [Oscillospiraceae bacterium]
MRQEIVDFLLESRNPRRYEPGEIIFSQGDAAEEFYYLLEGLSLTYTRSEEGRERNILISWPDRVFGASTFFESVPRRA